MPLPLAEFYPEDLTPDAAPREHEGPAPFLRRPNNPETIRRIAQQLRARHAVYWQNLPLARPALHEVHRAWSAARSPWREEAVALLHRGTGYPEAVIDRHLRKLFARMTHDRLLSWCSYAIGTRMDPVRDRARPALCAGPKLVVVVSSGNIPGAALPSVVQALLLGSPCLVKTASAEPHLLPLYARSIAALAPARAQTLAVTGWAGGDEALERLLLAEADALIAYGSDRTLLDLRSHLPAHARFIGYGHRISFSVISRKCLTTRSAKRLATGVALDAAVFDQQGCLSPQAVYMERGGEISPETFGELVAGQMARLERIIPRRPLSPAEAAAIHQYRADVEMRAFAHSGLRLWNSSGGTAWTVVLEENATLLPCPLNRTVVIRPLDRLTLLPDYLPSSGAMLLSAGLAVDEKELQSLSYSLTERGVTRLTRIGRAQSPEDLLYHDGTDAMAMLTRYLTTDGLEI